MLGDGILGACRVINHDARDDSSLVDLGESGNGVPTRLCRHWLEADLRITTGFVEPHFFAGFSGGPKMVAPGLAGLDTVLTLHDAARVGDPHSTWGIIDENANARRHPGDRGAAGSEAALQHGRSSGPPAADHARLRGRTLRDARPGLRGREADRHARDQPPVRGRGDDELRLSPRPETSTRRSRGCRRPAQVVKGGGTILCAAECSDGIPDHGRYAELLGTRRLARGTAGADRGSVHGGAGPVAGPGPGADPAPRPCAGQGPMGSAKTNSRPLTSSRRLISMPHSPTAWALGPDARVCVLPEGPQTIPYVAVAGAAAG